MKHRLLLCFAGCMWLAYLGRYATLLMPLTPEALNINFFHVSYASVHRINNTNLVNNTTIIIQPVGHYIC